MAQMILTPNNPDPTTGLIIPLLGWQFVTTSILDIFAGCNLIYVATGGQNGGWFPTNSPNPQSEKVPPDWYLVFQRTGYPAVIIEYTDWLAFDTRSPIRITQNDVNAFYTVTEQGGS